MRRRSAARRRLPSSRTTKNKRSFSSMIEIVMHILHHCNHEPALSARIEKTYLGNVDNKMKTRLSKSQEDAAKQFSLVLRSLPNTWAGFPKPGKPSKPGSNSANSMTMSALEEKRKSHILKITKNKSKGERMSNNHVQIVKDFFAAMRSGDM